MVTKGYGTEFYVQSHLKKRGSAVRCKQMTVDEDEMSSWMEDVKNVELS